MVHAAGISGTGIDLDPATSKVAQRTVKAKRYFTKVEDALSREWHGRIFMNPPYCREGMPRFTEKLIKEFRLGRVCQAIALVHSYTDPGRFHNLAGCASAICFTRGRIPFVSPYGGGKRTGSMEARSSTSAMVRQKPQFRLSVFQRALFRA